MLTSQARSQIYWDHTKVIAEMVDAYHVFCRSVFFNPEMANQYQVSMTKYVSYFTNIVRNIDVYLQEDQLMCTRLRFPLVPVPMYLPSNYELEQNDVRCIENTVYTEAREAEHEMLIIMNDQKISMIMLIIVCIVLFPGYTLLNLMTWALVSTGSVPLLSMGTYFRPLRTEVQKAEF